MVDSAATVITQESRLGLHSEISIGRVDLDQPYRPIVDTATTLYASGCADIQTETIFASPQTFNQTVSIIEHSIMGSNWCLALAPHTYLKTKLRRDFSTPFPLKNGLTTRGLIDRRGTEQGKFARRWTQDSEWPSTVKLNKNSLICPWKRIATQ